MISCFSFRIVFYGISRNSATAVPTVLYARTGAPPLSGVVLLVTIAVVARTHKTYEAGFTPNRGFFLPIP